MHFNHSSFGCSTDPQPNLVALFFFIFYFFLHIYRMLTMLLRNADSKPRSSSSSQVKCPPYNISPFLKWKVTSADRVMSQVDIFWKEKSETQSVWNKGKTFPAIFPIRLFIHVFLLDRIKKYINNTWIHNGAPVFCKAPWRPSRCKYQIHLTSALV